MARFYHSINATGRALPEGCTRFTLHLGTLPDGTYPGFRFVELDATAPDGVEDPRVVPIPNRLFFDVETTYGLHVVVDADIHEDGLPVVGYPGSVAIRTITKGSVDGSPVDLETANATNVPHEWFLLAFRLAALHSGGGGGITVDFGPDAPEGWQPDETAGRELTRRLREKVTARPGPKPPAQEKVVKAWQRGQLGWSLQRIADEEGVSKSTARRWIQQEQRRRDLLDDND